MARAVRCIGKTRGGTFGAVVVALGIAACDSGGANTTATSEDVDSSASTPLPSPATSSESSTRSGEDSRSGETQSSRSTEAGASSTDADSAEASSGTDSVAETCVEEITIHDGSTGRLDLPFVVSAGETPLEFGANVAVDSSESYALTLFGMFLTAPRLESEDGSLVDAVFLDAADRPLPYGIFFYHSDNPVTSMRLAAPPGNYRALQLHLGPPDECLGSVWNTPLNPDSEMYWSWGSTFLALRLEGRSQNSDAGDAGFSIHLGPLPGTPLVASNIRLERELTLTAQASAGPELRLDMSKVLFPHPADVPLAGHLPFADWLITNTATSAFELTP